MANDPTPVPTDAPNLPKSPLQQARADCLAQRTLFFQHFKAACIALGRYFDALDRATRLTNQTTRDNLLGVILPTDFKELQQLRFVEPPIHAVLAEGWQPHDGQGWNQQCMVIPVKRRFISASDHE